MATELERLFVRFEGRITELEKAMRQVDARTRVSQQKIEKGFATAFARVEQRAQAFAGRMQSALGLLGVGLGGATVVRGIRGAVAELSGIGKAADTIGVATDALQELRFAGKLAGVGIDVTDKALTAFTKRLGEAANGQGALVDILRRYGIAIRDGEGRIRAQADVIADLAAVLGRTESAAEKAAIAAAAFSRAGVQFGALVLGRGVEALNEAQRQFARAGGAYAEATIRDVERLDDELAIIWKRIVRNANEAAVAITAEADRIGKSGSALEKFLNDPTLENFLRFNFGESGRVLGLQFGPDFRDAAVQIGELQQRQAALGEEIERTQATIAGLGEATNALEEGNLRALEAALRRMVAEREAVERAIADLRALGGGPVEVTVTPARAITVHRPGSTQGFNVGANGVGPGSELRPSNADLAAAITAGAKEIVQGFKTVATETGATITKPLGDIYNAATAGADAGRDTADAVARLDEPIGAVERAIDKLPPAIGREIGDRLDGILKHGGSEFLGGGETISGIGLGPSGTFQGRGIAAGFGNAVRRAGIVAKFLNGPTFHKEENLLSEARRTNDHLAGIEKNIADAFEGFDLKRITPAEANLIAFGESARARFGSVAAPERRAPVVYDQRDQRVTQIIEGDVTKQIASQVVRRLLEGLDDQAARDLGARLEAVGF